MRISPKMRVKPLATMNSSAAKVMPLSAWKTVIDMAGRSGRSPRSRARLREVPVENLLARPEQDVRASADLLEYAAEIFQAMRRRHDVGMGHQRHHARRIAGVVMQLLELVHGTVVIL